MRKSISILLMGTLILVASSCNNYNNTKNETTPDKDSILNKDSLFPGVKK